MICPHCGISFNYKEQDSYVYVFDPHNSAIEQIGYHVSGGFCPECKNVILFLRIGESHYTKPNFGGYYWALIKEEEKYEQLYPKGRVKMVPQNIPSPYREEFLEAYAVFIISSKCSAALSRRILQNILRNEYKIKKKDLAQEIEEFINIPGIPSHIIQSVDAIRNVGNFAAHPIKSISTGEIAEVEPGEAEWLLEVLEALFDYTFIQPKILKDRIDKLNTKLIELGKPPMK